MHRLIIILFIGVFFWHNAFSQLHNFKTYSSEQGLPESKINALWEDRRGNLWIGTHGAGLFRFDGYTFFTYGEDEGLKNSFVTAIHGDSSGNLWIATESGVFVYDGIQFRLFEHLSKETVTAILRDSANNVWLGTSRSGLYKYDGKTLTPFKTTFRGVVDGKINCLYLDSHFNIWIGTPTGVAKYNKELFSFFTKDHGLASSQVYDVTEDVNGNLWFATDEALSKFDGKEFINYSGVNGLKGNRITDLITDNNNNLWISTSSGIVKYNSKTFQQYNAGVGQTTVMTNCSYIDSEGNLWFGTSEGLSKLDSERFTHFPENDQMGKRVYSITQAINGNIICGTSIGGTTVFDGEHYSLLDQREGFTSSIVQCFYYSPDSSLWVGTQDDGIFKFSKSSVNHYTKEDGLPFSNVTGFAMLNDENILVGSADKGLVLLQTFNDSLQLTKKYDTNNGLPSNRISAVVYDGSETIWIGTTDFGIVKLSLNGITETITNLTTTDGLGSNVVHSLILDSLNRIYVGTDQGISIYEGGIFHNLSKSDGLSSNNVYSLVIDRQANLWAGTARGVSVINLAQNFSAASIRQFGIQEGFKGLEVFRNSSCVDKNGNVWFGTINGLVKYDPQKDSEAGLPPKIHITGIKLFFDPIEKTEYGGNLSAWYPIPERLELPYHQNNLTFSFSGIYHRNPQAVHYKWILEGFSNEWSPELRTREAVFSNLPPGDYTFKVIACNEKFNWNIQPASFSFIIAAPVWQRWWFKLAGFLAVILLMWTIFYFRIKRIQAKNKIAREKLEMEKSIIELEQEASRLQMNPHFIFNCLNSIQGFISTNDSFQAKRYLAKFAKLMRLILENAREEFIPLQNEINILENYLALEKLSSNPQFEFNITVDESIDPERIQIPPMMIQPFVENAIIHGIRKKEGQGTISIHFKIEGGLLNCTIRDNGIGRKKAAAIKAQVKTVHKSTAIEITQKRLEQYGLFRHVKAGINITDLEEDGDPQGTAVIVSTPFESF